MKKTAPGSSRWSEYWFGAVVEPHGLENIQINLGVTRAAECEEMTLLSPPTRGR